ncbi:MAG: NUDIX hydrolase [Bryobacterales bacterium]|nr:NUDIX hydrolase [Bryobacterales bacterium]
MLGVGALILRKDSILLVERGKAPLKGYWSLPGGVLEIGEQLKDAVVREVKEETGLDIAPVAVVEIFERIMRDKTGKPEYHYVLVDYMCKVTGGELRAGDDSRKAEWIKRKDLANLKLTEGTLPVIERTFERYTPAGKRREQA